MYCSTCSKRGRSSTTRNCRLHIRTAEHAGQIYLDLADDRAMSRILLKLAELSLPSMLLRDFQLFVKIPVMQLI